MSLGKWIAAIVGGVLVLVIGAAIGGSLYLQHYSPYAPYLRGSTSLAIARALERNLENTGPFAPAAGDAVSTEQRARFEQVEERVATAVGASMTSFEQARAELERLHGAPGGLTVRLAVKAVGDMGQPFRAAKKAQCEALDAASFSLEEFEWVRRRLYAAVGVELRQLDLDAMREFTDIQDRVAIRRRSPSNAGSSATDADANARLRRWGTLAFFGL